GQPVLDHLLRADAYIKTGKYDQAIELLSSIISEQQDSRLYAKRADAYIVNGDYSAAIADLNASNDIVKFSGEYGLARVYAMKGDAATSLYHLEISMKSPFRKSEKEIMLDPAFSKIENSQLWRQFWRNPWYTGLETRISEIEYYVGAGKTSDAAAILSEIESNYFEEENLKYARALVDYSAGKLEDAVITTTDLLNSDPDNEKYLRLQARLQTLSSNHAGASLTYTKMITNEIPDVELYMRRAESYRKTGQTDKALADIEKYLSYYPEDKTALTFAGRTLAADGDNLEALRYFSLNLKMHPNDPQCYIDRANTYMLSKSYEWAINDFSMALDLDPYNSEVWLNKGIALLGSRKTEDACHDFRQSFILGNKKATDYISRYCIK
ncbi:MAG: tetratricopeptide repeat protein, partial [Bacteroidales bacterium]|nr:tetratricopeptide repeat protein [Bacteroidales bacterium]